MRRDETCVAIMCVAVMIGLILAGLLVLPPMVDGYFYAYFYRGAP